MTTLNRVYQTRAELPKGAETLYDKRGALFIMRDAKRDFVADNPWEPDNWNLTEQGKFLSQHGRALADVFAKIAGTVIGGVKPTFRQPPLQVLVQRRDITTINGGGSGTGSSGDGPPT